MDPPSANLPFWVQTDLSHPMQSHYVAHQAYEPYSIQVPPDLVLQTQPQGSHLTAGQSYVPYSFNLSPALHVHPPYSTGHFNNAPQTIPSTPMGPPTRPRKRKAPTLRADAWEPHKARIIELHITQKLPLRKVKEIMKEQHGFTAEYVA